MCMHGSKCKIGSYCTVGRRLQELNILGGLILPVWGTIEKALAKQERLIHKRIRVVRLVTTNDSQRIVGLLIPNSAVESVLTGLFLISQRSSHNLMSISLWSEPNRDDL
ncbi:RING/FYVE/PHD zinc finger superfamily protein [Zea mays]|uniref:RING/FYVE/PHD zinc finger superfamily protein n=1 Tax=Zea mays TaxID=4577 RepID=A0A1D6JDZ0_MAIZE|nr:RING/FYVE/PHD zinc finger superfamily protein [Zea mays]